MTILAAFVRLILPTTIPDTPWSEFVAAWRAGLHVLVRIAMSVCRRGADLKPITVLLVEDDAHTREGLGEAVRRDPGLCLLGDAGTYAEARERLARHRPDVLLIDLGLPDGDGTELIRQACSDGSPTQAMVITVFGDERHVVRALEAGATGYLLKDADLDQIAASIRQLADGQCPISPAIARYLLRRFQPDPAPAVNLTDREAEVLSLVAKGYSYAEIAEGLALSVHTARAHIRNIYGKLSVRTRGEAVYEAMQIGLVTRD